ncbi:hypothetical protein ACGFH8_29905 [Micromonospora sp. NPDC049175]|uniref:hypothetical protein n=1 Tax=Micromonospora sp. NPDC049175 TaxID=3364266 RepID=UPI00371FCA62
MGQHSPKFRFGLVKAGFTMALEWSIEGGRPLDPQSLVEQVGKTLEMLADTAVVVHLEQDVRMGSEPAEGGPEFSFVLKSEIAGKLSSVELVQLGSDSSSGTCIGYVTANRDRGSVALGVVVAAHWNMAAGGDLSGTGLGGKRLSPEESEGLLADLFHGATWEDRAERAAGRLGCGQVT